jgi:hypothetical protein
MQASPCYAHKVLLKTIFYFENLFITGLKLSVEYWENLGICLIWSICANSMKQFRNPEKEKIKKWENRKRATGEPSSPVPNPAHGPARQNPKGYAPSRWQPDPMRQSSLLPLAGAQAEPNSPLAVDLLSCPNPNPSHKASATYKSLETPSPASFFLFARDAARMAEFAIGVPPLCEHHRWNSSPTVNPNPSLSSYPLCFTLAHLPDHHAPFNSQRIERLTRDRSTLPPCAAPAVPLSSFCKQTVMPIKLSRSPRRPEARRDLDVA